MARMRFARWLSKRNTHSECVVITAFPRQQWLSERPSILRYAYVAWVFTRVLLKTKGRTVVNRVRVSTDKKTLCCAVLDRKLVCRTVSG
jgi:hypothetical protein